MRSSPRTIHFPAAPLADLIRFRAGDEPLKEVARQVANRLNKSVEALDRMIYRIMNAQTVTLAVMDDWCIGLGKHPVELYGHVYETGVSDEVNQAS